MQLYYTGASPENLRKARKHAPSHTHGYGWTPNKMTPHDAPYFLDNGAYTESFDPIAWAETVEEALFEMPRAPDFVVMPDVFGDAEATIERHQRWCNGQAEATITPVGNLRLYWVLQPGLPIEEQFECIPPGNFDGVFVGGPKRWKRAHGDEIVRQAQERDLRTHVGNPGGEDGLVWAYETGFDSCDTTTVFQNGYWHYLQNLEQATEYAGRSPEPEAVKQTSLGGAWGDA